MFIIKMPIACLLIVSYSFYCYMIKRNIQTYSTVLFKALNIIGIINLLSDAITEYTVNHMDRVNGIFNDFWHIIFLLSLLYSSFIIYYYFLSYIEMNMERKLHLQKLVSFVFMLTATIFIIILPITYIYSIYGSYSLGPKAYMLHIAIVYVMILMIYNIIKYKKYVDSVKKKISLISIFIFTVFAIFQIIFPYILTTALALSLVIMGIMMTTEDTYQYIDSASRLYNENGFFVILKNLKYLNSKINFTTLIFTGDTNDIIHAINKLGNYMEKDKFFLSVILYDNVVVLVPRSRNKPHKDINYVQTYYSKFEGIEIYIDNYTYSTNTDIDVILSDINRKKNHYDDMTLYKDELTGLLLRRSFITQIRLYIKVKISFTLVMIDLDNFKDVNDLYGHTAGDTVLKSVADIFRSSLRHNDLICRMGGDEFALLLLGITSYSNVSQIIETILKKIKKLPTEFNYDVKLDASAGICYYEGESSDISFEELYNTADKALYQAKENGKGKYVQGEIIF